MDDPSKNIAEGDPKKNNAMITEVLSSSFNRITLTGRNHHRPLTKSKPKDDATWDVVDVCILG